MAALLDHLARQFPDSSRTTLRQMLQHGRVRVNGEVEKDAKRDVDDDDIVDVAPKSVTFALPPGLALLHEDDDLVDRDGRPVRAVGHRLRGKSARIEGAFGNPLGRSA